MSHHWIGPTFAMIFFCVYLLFIGFFVSCPTWYEDVGSCMRHWSESQWKVLLPYVFIILKIILESNDGVPFLIIIPNYPRYMVIPKRMKSMFLLNFFWMVTFDHPLFIHFTSFLNIFFTLYICMPFIHHQIFTINETQHLGPSLKKLTVVQNFQFSILNDNKFSFLIQFLKKN